MTQAAKDAAKFLKSTLRLPSSTFPPRPPPGDIEKYLTRCSDDLYAWQRQNRPANNTFRLHDGPPYANGELHVGHALNKILKDIICRSKLAEGRRVDYTPGWDCHGLPIELKALEKHGWKKEQNVEASAIRDAARTFAQQTVRKQMAGFRSWGVMGDWGHHWKTMDRDFEIRQLQVFQAMAKNGLIYRKNKPVFWSPSSGTALAEAELEYKEDHLSTAAFVKFPIRHFDSSPVYALIWTTTPWTLPANQAIAINHSLQYVLVKSEKHGLLIVAAARVDALRKSLDEELEIVQEVLDSTKLLNHTYDGLHHFGQQALNRPFIHADFVSADSGTGLVHCAPGHGMEDYLALQPLIRSGQVVVRAPVDATGRYNSDASPETPDLLQGSLVFSAGNDSVLRLLGLEGLLVHSHPFRHKYPIDWRTKEPVIIRATSQWFADLSSIREEVLGAIDQVRFVPDTGKARLRSFVEGRAEWCISRQRAWGVPIPAVYNIETGDAVLTEDSVKHIIQVIQTRGIDAWWSDAEDDPAWILPSLNAAEFRRGRDTMDVWFDSGTSWTGMAQNDTNFEQPLADVYLEGTDQHRGWFQSSLLTHVAYQKSTRPTQPCRPVFASLMTHGFTLDAQGKKMSKSLGNVVSPNQIITGLGPAANSQPPKVGKKNWQPHPLGPDALRLWVASSDWTTDVVISETAVKTVHTALDKYRVTLKLLLGLLKDFDPRSSYSYDQLCKLDRIALLQLAKVVKTTWQAYSAFEFHKAVTAINRWVAADLSGFYFEAIKDISYCDSPANSRRMSVCTTLHHILSHLQGMLAPIAPLLIEESWEHSPESLRSSLEHPLRRVRPDIPSEWANDRLESLLPMIMSVNSSVKQAQEEARSKKLLGQSLASDVLLRAHPSLRISEVPIQTWREILVVSNVVVEEAEEWQAHQSLKVEDRSWHFKADIFAGSGTPSGAVVVASPTKEKCSRCWRFVADPARQDQSPLCDRCEDVVREFQTQV